MTNRRSGFPPVTLSSTFYVFSNYGGHNHLCHLFAVYGVWTDYSIFHLITKLSSKGWLAIAKLKPLSLFISLLLMLKKALDNGKMVK